ncbi:MAG: RidA family protein [Calditrichaeota bacterium]|nr:RidA family protein [Calditrichota bacterium]RQW03970.1 MAG: RidA family protein [Calditrichota bacterium]
MKRVNISSGVKWEPIVGYSRAVKVGAQVYVAGTTAIAEDGHLVGKGDPYLQTVQVIKNIRKALQKAGGDLHNIVANRIYVRNMSDWEKIGRAHGEYFGDIRPATTMVEVSALVEPDMLVEIDSIAVLDDED